MKGKFTILAAMAVLTWGSVAVAQPGEYAPPPPVYAPSAPPPPRGEVVAPLPGPPERFVWERGHYEWNGRAYFWVPGHYVERPEVGLIWVPGRWVDYHGGWRWIGGHWRR